MAINLNANTDLIIDDNGIIRELDHSLEPYRSPSLRKMSTKELAEEYLRQVAVHYKLTDKSLSNLTFPKSKALTDEKTEFRFLNEKKLDNISVVTFEQNYYGIPVLNSNLSVRINSDTMGVLGSSNNSHYELMLDKPNLDSAKFAEGKVSQKKLQSVLGLENLKELPSINSVSTAIYLYKAEDRLTPELKNIEKALEVIPPTIDIPEVDKKILDNKYYTVSEVFFTLKDKEGSDMNWRTLIEIQTGSVLYLRALVSGISGSIFQIDPVTQGCSDCRGGTSEDKLNKSISEVPVPGLIPPQNNVQSLEGNYVKLEDIAPPNIAPPTKPAGENFYYGSTTNDFSAINAYYHCDFVFRYISELGIDVPTYFGGTSFPVPVDHRGKGGAVNASANGNAAGNGLGSLRFGIVEQNYNVGIATALRVVLHEFGHALLWNHVNSPNFGFAHSAGDSMAAIYADPNSLAPDKGETFPFITNSNPGMQRRHDRTVSDGWAWFGTHYNTQYGGEQVLSTTLFRTYQSTGGGSSQLTDKQFASMYMFYLIVKSCGMLTHTTTDPKVYVNALMQADKNTVDFQNQTGGTNYKVIRWSFEKQGLYQKPGTPKPYTQPGEPPAVDVYINDGREGEYQYLNDWQNCQDIWNRNSNDGGSSNQTPILNKTNYLYVRLKNRGTDDADNIKIKCYQSNSSVEFNWPQNWAPALTSELPVIGSVASKGETVVGPFEWTPNISSNMGVLMVASADGDPSIVDNPVIQGKPLGNWRLVPFDNNIAQRNFSVS
ncbi:MAG: hypothetical protein PVH88_09305 [Ignavibacteria bacterium]|jgi:hypothetical protein